MASLVAPREVVADHVLAPVFLFGRRVASVEVFFGAPVVVDAAVTSFMGDGDAAGVALRVRSVECTEAQRRWFDFAVHCAGDDAPSTPQQQQRRIKAAGDWSWLRSDVKPEALGALEGDDAATARCPVVAGTHAWRLLVVDLLCAWISNCLLMQRHEAFVDTIGVFHERLSFEYHSFLCGVGDTSAAWHVSAMRQAPSEWLWLHPRATFQLQRDQRSSTPSLLRCRIPLLCDSDMVRTLQSNVEAWMELFCKLSGIPCVDRLAAVQAAELVVSAVVFIDLELVNSVAYRVVYESISANFKERREQEQQLDGEALHAMSTASSSDDDVAPCEPYSTRWWCDLLQRSSVTTGDALRQQSGASSPMVSPRGAPSSPRATAPSSTPSPPPPAAQPSLLPSFSAMHRTHNATLMEYIPELEARLMVGCIGEALHFLSLIHTLTETYGAPAAISCAVKDSFGSKQRRFATFRVLPSPPPSKQATQGDEGEEVAVGETRPQHATANVGTIVVTVVYDTSRTPPVVTVSSPGRSMPNDPDRPLAANVRLRPAQAIGNLAADENFNVLVMSQCIVVGVRERRQQIIDICTIQAADVAAAVQRASRPATADTRSDDAAPPVGVGGVLMVPPPAHQHHVDPMAAGGAPAAAVPEEECFASCNGTDTPMRRQTTESGPSTPKSSMPSPSLLAREVSDGVDESEHHPELRCTQADAPEDGESAAPTLAATAVPEAPGAASSPSPPHPDGA